MSIFQNNLLAAAASTAAGGATAYQLWGWGYRNRKFTRNEDPDPPLRISGEQGDWLKVSFNTGGGFAINTSGELFSWGYGTNGRLGVGNTTNYNSSTATKYKQIGTLTDWDQVGGDQNTITAVKTDGTLWTWGRAENGELGNGTTSPDLCSPVQVGSLTDWAKVSIGSAYFSVGAVKTDGTLWAWGGNAQGQLGQGDKTNTSSPVQIGALTTWADIRAGGEDSFFAAVKTDGTLWTWGNNKKGQLGHGNKTSLSSPAQVGSLTDWTTKFSCGSGSSFGIKTDGTLWSWGTGYRGRLGHGNTTDLSSPVQIGALTTWKDVATGYNWTMGLKTDGTLWGWGFAGSTGVNGTGTNTTYSSPVQIGEDTDWRVLAAAAALKGEAL